MADNEEEILDSQEEALENVEDTDSDESLNSEWEDNTPAKAKNKSNWKKMKQELKALKAQLASYQSDDSDDDESDEETIDTDEPISTKYAPLELKVLFLENSDAKEYEQAVRANLKKYPDMEFDDALALAKASNPQSTTKKGLGLATTATKAKDIADLSAEEALKLPDDQYLVWARKTGNLKE